jgi:hypothetical protein
MGTQNRSALNVRFTYDGTNMYVMIGELAQTWSYPQVFITDVQVGYTNYEYTRWDDGWVISFDAATYHTIGSTHTVFPPTSSTNNVNPAYASIFYDANNTAYYIDPNSTSNLLGLTVTNTITGNITGSAGFVSRTVAAGGFGILAEATMGDNDFFRIGVGGASNAGFAEIATADDGNEPIYVRQYSGIFTTLTRTATLLDGSGNTSFPGALSAGNISTGVTANHIVQRDGNGYIYANHINFNTSETENPTINSFITSNGDGWSRKSSLAHAMGSIRGVASGSWGISITGNAATATTATTSSYCNNLTQGFNSNWNTDFAAAPAGSTILRGDTSTGSSTGGPGGTWWFQQNMRHANAGNVWGTQVAWGWEDNAGRLRTRNVQNGSYGGWIEYLSTAGHTYSGNLTLTGSIISSASDVRAPIFYDQNNTGYYINPNGGSRTRNIEVAAGHGDTQIRLTALQAEMGSGIQSAMTWWISEPGVSWNDAGFGYNVTNDNGTPGGFGRLNTSYGQGYARYLTNGNIIFYNTNTSGTRSTTMQLYPGSIVESYGDFRAPIFYDSNNTDYRIDPTDVSRIVLIRADHYGRAAHNTGFLRGGYNNIGASEGQTSPIYCIGSSYEPAATTLSSMYGIGFTSGGSFFPSGASGWGLYVADNGVARVFLSGGNGEITATGNITAYASDRRLKTNITPITNAVDKLMQINGVEFDWVDNIQDIGFIPQQMHETGVIAQEIQAVIPDAVKTAPFNKNATDIAGFDSDYLTVDKEKIVPLLIEAIKEQQAHINRLEEKINLMLDNK